MPTPLVQSTVYALLSVAMVFFSWRTVTDEQPFCEECKRFLKESSLGYFTLDSTPAILAYLKSGDGLTEEKLGRLDDWLAPSVQVKHAVCNCGELHYLHVFRSQPTRDGNKDVDSKLIYSEKTSEEQIRTLMR
jgi:hypothetical protein